MKMDRINHMSDMYTFLVSTLALLTACTLPVIGNPIQVSGSRSKCYGGIIIQDCDNFNHKGENPLYVKSESAPCFNNTLYIKVAVNSVDVKQTDTKHCPKNPRNFTHVCDQPPECEARIENPAKVKELSCYKKEDFLKKVKQEISKDCRMTLSSDYVVLKIQFTIKSNEIKYTIADPPSATGIHPKAPTHAPYTSTGHSVSKTQWTILLYAIWYSIYRLCLYCC